MAQRRRRCARTGTPDGAENVSARVAACSAHIYRRGCTPASRVAGLSRDRRPARNSPESGETTSTTSTAPRPRGGTRQLDERHGSSGCRPVETAVPSSPPLSGAVTTRRSGTTGRLLHGAAHDRRDPRNRVRAARRAAPGHPRPPGRTARPDSLRRPARISRARSPARSTTRSPEFIARCADRRRGRPVARTDPWPRGHRRAARTPPVGAARPTPVGGTAAASRGRHDPTLRRAGSGRGRDAPSPGCCSGPRCWCARARRPPRW